MEVRTNSSGQNELNRPENSSRFFRNPGCEYFPCHEMKPDDFSCLFCYCPMFHIECLGDPSHVVINDNLAKDCSRCDFPHRAENYETIVQYLTMVLSGAVG